ncbi:hypothetical protein M758_N028300 [Ceratodon purpureus]|nr:hypothetical protein M758_N028300 [Ceratodon purpureus]
MVRMVTLLCLFPCCLCSPPLFPAIFIFGDSLLDAGNNNYLQAALAKADTLPNGIDFPTHSATGRFCNGKTVTDFIADYVGLDYAPPYLAPTTHGNQLLQGVNYASGAGGILDESGAAFNGRLSFNMQISYFNTTLVQLGELLGAAKSATLLTESLIVVSMGTNDYIHNYMEPNSPLRADYDPEEFHTFLASQLKARIKTLCNLGARKFLLLSVGPFGCIPSRIAVGSSTGKCVASDNEMAEGFNTAMQVMIQELSRSFPKAVVLYGNTYSAVLDVIKNAAELGFDVINSGCCAFGRLKGQVPCGLLNEFTHALCPNRSKYFFWDEYHPTEAVNIILSEGLLSGNTSNIEPMNLYELSQWAP